MSPTELRAATPMFRRRPLLYGVCVGVLALGISTAGVGYAFLFSLHRPDLPRFDEVASIGLELPGAPGVGDLPHAVFVELRARCTSCRHVAGRSSSTSAWASPGGAAEPLVIAAVSEQFFELEGRRPAVGRSLTDADHASGAPLVLVLGHSRWRRSFGADGAVVGRGMVIGGRAYTIVGVMPPGTADPDAWVAAARGGLAGGPPLTVRIRRRPAVSWEAVRAEIGTMQSVLRHARPDMASQSLRVRTVEEHLDDRRRTAGLAMLVPLLVLLISILNVGNLLVGHALRRRGEIAVRVALGATRRQLARQFLAEGMVVAGPAGAAAVLFAAGQVRALRAFAPDRLAAITDRVTLDWQTLVFVAAVTLSTPLVLALVPLTHVKGVGVPQGARKTGAVHGGFGRYTPRDLLVILQVAAAFIVMGTFATVHGVIWELTHPYLGFDRDRLIVIDGGLTPTVVEQIRTVPGVAVVTTSNELPFTERVAAAAVEALDGAQGTQPARVRAVGPDYFGVLGVVPSQGGGMAADAVAARANVAVISEGLAHRLWPGTSPLGRRVRARRKDQSVTFDVVGVVPDMAYLPRAPTSRNSLYIPREHSFVRPAAGHVLIRVARDVPVEATRVAVSALLDRVHDGAKAARSYRSVGRDGGDLLFVPRLVGGVGLLGLLLAVVGVAAVTWEAVHANLRELGIRAALGAAPRALVRLALTQASAKVGVGLVLGLPGPFLFWSREISGRLGTVADSASVLMLNPLVMLPTAAAVLAVLIAAYVPARRAGGADLVSLMRAE